MSLTVVGLGNPGPRYQHTPHNVGFRTVDLLASRLGIRLKKPLFQQFLMGSGSHRGQTLFLVKPLTFMNRSGQIMSEALKRSATERLLVVCDTLDLPPGTCRLKRRGSSAGNRGLASIIRSLGTDRFLRLYLGVGRPARRDQVVDYLLSVPGSQEGSLIEEAVQIAADGILELLHQETEVVMNALNRRKNSSLSETT